MKKLAISSATLYKPSTSQSCHLSPEDGDSMYLQNIGIDLQNNMVPKPKSTPTHSNHCKNLTSHIVIQEHQKRSPGFQILISVHTEQDSGILFRKYVETLKM